MTTLEIGKKLVELCNQGKQDVVMDTMYATDIVSVEAGGPPNMPREMSGLQAVQGKAKWWNENHIIHSSKCEGPWPNGDQFAVKFTFDVTNKPQNKRITMEEIAVYTVKNDKITREVFFYDM
jgi:hypothetical protein